MNILFVEGSDRRLKLFRNIYSNHVIHVSEDIDEILQWLSTIEFDMIHLDYDLTHSNSEEIAELIKTRNSNPIIIIHSDNEKGAKIIGNILPSALVIPFQEFDKKNNVMSLYKSLVANNHLTLIEQIKQVFNL